MENHEQKDFEMFAAVWDLHKKCRDAKLPSQEIRDEAKNVIQSCKTDLCKNLVKVVMEDYFTIQNAKGKN